MSNHKITVEQKEEEDAVSKECCTAALVNSRRNENTVACVHLRHPHVDHNLHIRPCKTRDTNKRPL